MTTRAERAERLLEATPPKQIADAMAKIAEGAIKQIDRSLPRALEGDPSQVRLYVAAYCALSERAIETVETARPDLLAFDRQHHVVLLVEAKHSRGKSPQPDIPWMKSMLAGEAMSAPFSQWVGHFGAGRGTAVAIVALLREALPGMKPLSVPARHRLPAWNVKDTDVVRFYRAVSEALEGSETPLERIRSVLGLSRTDLAGLFGVKRQALERWDTHGVPAERQKKLATLSAIVDLLTAQLKSDRIAGVVRRKALAYGNRSILEAIAAGNEEAVLDELRSAFDWASAA
jgi:hypothetical protein